MATRKDFNNYFVQQVKLNGTNQIKVQFPAAPSRLDITTSSDSIEFAIGLENEQRVQFISMAANSFYSIDIEAKYLIVKGTSSAAASTVQVVGWYEVI